MLEVFDGLLDTQNTSHIVDITDSDNPAIIGYWFQNSEGWEYVGTCSNGGVCSECCSLENITAFPDCAEQLADDTGQSTGCTDKSDGCSRWPHMYIKCFFGFNPIECENATFCQKGGLKRGEGSLSVFEDRILAGKTYLIFKGRWEIIGKVENLVPYGVVEVLKPSNGSHTTLTDMINLPHEWEAIT